MKIYLPLIVLLISTSSLISQIYLDIDIHQAKDTIESNIDNSIFTILDVRTAGEYLPEHIDGAFNRDFYADDFDLQLDSLDKSRTFLVYCQSGNRSGQTLQLMESLGFERVYNILGGMSQWNQAGYPVTDVIPEFVNIYEMLSGLSSTELGSLKIYPNPFANSISLDLGSENNTSFYYKVISQNGRELMSGVVQSSNEIDLSLLGKGVYNLLIYENDKLTSTSTMIKQ